MRTAYHHRFARSLAVIGSVAVSLFMGQAAMAAAWVAQTPDTSVGFTSVAFASDAYGVAVGGSDHPFVTTNGGKTWSQASYTAPNSAILHVTMTTGGIAYAVGASGMMIKGTNSTTWTTLYPDTSANLRGVDCVSDVACWVVGSGGTILKTTNGGANWTAQVSGVANELMDVDFVSSEVGWAVGRGGRVLKTTNGGANWTVQASGVESDLFAVTAIDSNTAWFGGVSSVLRKTTNGGAVWTSVSTGVLPAGTWINDIFFRNSSEGYLAADGGWLLQTSNGGTSWSGMATNTVNMIRSIAGTANYLWAVGDGALAMVYDGIGPGAPSALSAIPSAVTNDNTPTFSWTAATDAVSQIQDYGFKVDSGLFTAIGNVLSHSPSAMADGVHTVHVTARDLAGNYGAESSLQVTIDTTVPTVGTIGPLVATTGVTTEFSSNVSDPLAGIESCLLVVNGSMTDQNGDPTFMSYDSVTGKAKRNHTFATAGTYSLYTRCTDRASNVTNGNAVNVVVSAAMGDTTAPVVTGLAPSAATLNVATNVTAAVSDAVGVSSCRLQVNSVDQGVMTLSGGTATKSHTFGATGNYTVIVTCADAAANSGSQTITTAVSAPSADTTAPAVSTPWPPTATAGVSLTMYASFSDAIGVTACDLYVGGINQGAMTLSGTTASRSHTFTSIGAASVQVRCRDAVGNVGTGFVTVDVLSATASSTTPSATTSYVSVNPSAVAADNSSTATVTVTVKNSSGTALEGKIVTLSTSRYSVDTIGVIAGTTNDLGQATFSIRSSSNGNSTLTAVADGRTLGSANVGFNSSVVTPPGQNPSPGSLIKLACAANAVANDPCTSVYYYGTDGKRHAFPNDKVYATWYSGFGSVQTVTAAFLQSLALGKNVTYRPGTKLVKFQSLNTVYAVSRYGVLRAISSEAVARALYGDAWGTVVHDVSDVFYMNYMFGTDITSSANYSPAGETAAVTTIDANF